MSADWTRGRSGPPRPSEPRDLLVTNARIFDVFGQETYRGWFTVQDGRFLEVEEGELAAGDEPPAQARLDLAGATVQPGLIDAHMHIESSLVTPRRFAEAVLPHGTTTILQDPHEVANVLGAEGMRWMVRASQGLPLRVLSAISSCIPATSPEVETPNASLDPAEVTALAGEANVVALGEMMDFQGLVQDDPRLVAIVRAGAEAGLSLEGHVPTLRGPALSRYLAHGIRSDHTLMTPAKVREQHRKGLWIQVQEKSLSEEVVATIMALPERSRVLLITDDVMPNRLTSGHLSRIVTTAVQRGWDPLDAAAAASLRPAAYLGLRDVGAIAPGYRADYLVCEQANAFPPQRVVVSGATVAEDGVALPFDATTPPVPGASPALPARELPPALLRLHCAAGRTRVRSRVIVVNQVNSFTELDERAVDLQDGVPLDPELSLAAVLPRAALREGVPDSVPVGLVAGLGLKRGGWAASFAHDSHNVFLLGRDPEAITVAARAMLAAGGGMAFAPGDGSPTEVLPLPVAGLLSDAPVAEVAERFAALEDGLRDAGVTVLHPVLLLTLLPLTVSPDWKISDKGIVDVARRRVLPPLIEDPGASGGPNGSM